MNTKFAIAVLNNEGKVQSFLSRASETVINWSNSLTYAKRFISVEQLKASHEWKVAGLAGCPAVVSFETGEVVQ